MKQSSSSVLVCLAILLLSASLAWTQQVVEVDFGSNVSISGGNWNNVPNDTNSLSNMIDFNTGLDTGISVKVIGAGSSGGNENCWIAGDKDWVSADAAKDYFFRRSGGTVTVTFSLLTGSSYTVEIVSSSTSSTYISDITIDGSFATRNYNGSGSLGDDWNTDLDGRQPGSWLIWDDVEPTDGKIIVSYVLASGGGATINAARLLDTTTPVELQSFEVH